jgi:hypothetical protein
VGSVSRSRKIIYGSFKAKKFRIRQYAGPQDGKNVIFLLLQCSEGTKNYHITPAMKFTGTF